MISNKTNNEIVVGMADIKTGKAPTEITTSLGSCIGVCLYSSKHKAGGILHLMMDYAGSAANKADFKKAKYADTGIVELIRQVKQSYVLKEKDCIAKIFGGAQILKAVTNRIGDNNEKAVRDILRSIGIPIVASKTGGDKGCKIRLHLATGVVTYQMFGGRVEEY